MIRAAGLTAHYVGSFMVVLAQQNASRRQSDLSCPQQHAPTIRSFFGVLLFSVLQVASGANGLSIAGSGLEATSASSGRMCSEVFGGAGDFSTYFICGDFGGGCCEGVGM